MVDSREPAELVAELRKFGFPVTVLTLDHGDAYWSGHGPEGDILIGFERKRLLDLLDSVRTRRLAGSQLVGMREAYDRSELVVEGLWRPGNDGLLQVPGRKGWEPLFFQRQGFSYRQVDGYLHSLSECAGVRVWRTGSTLETAHLYSSRYHWWQKKWADHGSHKAIYTPDPDMQRRGRAVFHQGEPSPVCKVAAILPGIDAKAWSVAEQYPSIFSMVCGHEMTDTEYEEAVERWRSTTWTDSAGKTKRFGRKTAEEIVAYLRSSKS